MRIGFGEALTKAQDEPDRYHVAVERGGLELGMYAPDGVDPQSPHDRDELYVIARGSATWWEAGRTSEVAAGDALRVRAHVEHRFVDPSPDFVAWVVFDRAIVPPLVPAGVEVPDGVELAGFRLRLLGPEHNARDHAAWTGSIDHIRATPGFPDGDWPRPMTLDENLIDLEMHASHSRSGAGFTYTVLAPDGDEDDAAVLGCVYIYPADDDEHDVEVQMWVTADQAERDASLHNAVLAWLSNSWSWAPERILSHAR